MAGNILRKAGVVLLTILKGLLQVILYILKFILTVAKIVLLLFSLVLRAFLSLFGVQYKMKQEDGNENYQLNREYKRGRGLPV